MVKTKKHLYGGYAKANLIINRIFDILFSLILIILSLPFLLIIAIIIKLVDNGPVLYKGERLGHKKNIFIMYKFRTLVPGSEEIIGARLLTTKDSVVTPVGKFLRDTRLDELPQLFNILKGDMDFVGPRPERPLIYDKFCKHIKNYDKRFLTKPGLVGYSQLFTPYSSPKRIRSMIDNTLIRNKQRFMWDIFTVLYTSTIVIVVISWKLIIISARLLKICNLYDEKRASVRVYPRLAKVFVGSIVDGKEMFTIEAELVNINADAFLINANHKINHNYSVFKLQTRTQRHRMKHLGAKTKTAYCHGKIIREIETKKEQYKYSYVIKYTPISPLNSYMIHQYFLFESFAH